MTRLGSEAYEMLMGRTEAGKSIYSNLQEVETYSPSWIDCPVVKVKLRPWKMSYLRVCRSKEEHAGLIVPSVRGENCKKTLKRA